MNTVQPAVNFINVEYFFRILYDLVFGIHAPSTNGLAILLTEAWLAFTIIAYIFCIVCIGVFVYQVIRINQIREDENAKFATISEPEEHAQVEHSRWQYIMSLIESGHEASWRQAIIEADIMLDEALTRAGYEGASVGDKLKTMSATHFHSLQDAWDAHRIRNEIAHQGSGFELTEVVAYHTIQKYENAFRELGEI